MVWLVIWVVLMLFWICFGIYSHDPANRVTLVNTIIPWSCVAIIGAILFGAIGIPAIR